MGKPILCIDFDGVIHSYTSGWKGAHVIPDPPVPGAITYLLTAIETFDVAIFSSRSRNPLGRWAMKRWLAIAVADHWEAGGTEPTLAECECWGDAAGIYRRFSWPWFKPAALVSIDDRALTFNGDWTSAEYQARAIRSFKPWNKRPAKAQPAPHCMATMDLSTDSGLICDLCEERWPNREVFSCARRPGQW